MSRVRQTGRKKFLIRATGGIGPARVTPLPFRALTMFLSTAGSLVNPEKVSDHLLPRVTPPPVGLPAASPDT